MARDLETFEWPAQISRVQYDSSEPAYKELETESNFECFNECVQDPECALAVRSSNQSGLNCYLKNSVTSKSSLDLDPDTEYGLVSGKLEEWLFLLAVSLLYKFFYYGYNHFKITKTQHPLKSLARTLFTRSKWASTTTSALNGATFRNPIITTRASVGFESCLKFDLVWTTQVNRCCSSDGLRLQHEFCSNWRPFRKAFMGK